MTKQQKLHHFSRKALDWIDATEALDRSVRALGADEAADRLRVQTDLTREDIVRSIDQLMGWDRKPA